MTAPPVRLPRPLPPPAAAARDRDPAGRRAALRALQRLPGVGPSIAADLLSLGVRAPADLAGADPLDLFARLQARTGQRQDPCVLDVFRCAVQAASGEQTTPELSRWWTWSRLRKEGLLPEAPRPRSTRARRGR